MLLFYLSRGVYQRGAGRVVGVGPESDPVVPAPFDSCDSHTGAIEDGKGPPLVSEFTLQVSRVGSRHFQECLANLSKNCKISCFGHYTLLLDLAQFTISV